MGVGEHSGSVSGFDRYERFYTRDPAIVVEWHDDRTSARGWLCMNSLRGGAAGGGTRMRPGGSREEAVFLAKTMEVKFRVCGPEIGGGKSVIDFDPRAHPDQKAGVLERWYRHVGPYLRACYGTGGDVGVDELEAARITERVLGIAHVQEGLARGHYTAHPDGEPVEAKVARLRPGTEARVVLPDLPGPRDGGWVAADVATGFGVVRAIERLYAHQGRPLAGQRAVIEGFGAVGAFAAYYLARLGVRIVGVSSAGPSGSVRVLTSPRGLEAGEVNALITRRDGTALPPVAPGCEVLDTATGDELFSPQADIFVPAGPSHTITARRADLLRRAGVRVVSCGANNPFWADPSRGGLRQWVADMLDVQRRVDPHMAVIPDFVANCGMARAFAYLMSRGARPDADAILRDVASCIDEASRRLLEGWSGPGGLLERGYSIFVPD
jgi:glutamate dehydrogenase (NAD(P)+)